jgi:hypothetical protein
LVAVKLVSRGCGQQFAAAGAQGGVLVRTSAPNISIDSIGTDIKTFATESENRYQRQTPPPLLRYRQPKPGRPTKHISGKKNRTETTEKPTASPRWHAGSQPLTRMPLFSHDAAG